MGDAFQILRPATRDTTKFKEIRPASHVTKVRGTIVLPAFSFTGLTWKGASQLHVQFNFAMGQNFTLPQLPSGTGRNFCLAIRWRVGTAPYRYKLWQDVNEELYPPLLYVNEVVKPNFTLEVWTTTANEVSLASPLVIPTSIMALPLTPFSYPAITTQVLATGTQRIPNNFGVINPTAGTNVLDYLATNA